MRTLTITSSPRTTNHPPAKAPARLARARRAAAEIAPETIERIAQRVAQLLHHEPPQPPEAPDDTHPARVGLLTANQLAQHLGLNRTWVYEHAAELGAIRIGTGPRARLRFDLETAVRGLGGRQPRDLQPAALPRIAAGARPGRPRRRADTRVPLLPVHEPRTRGVLSRWSLARRSSH